MSNKNPLLGLILLSALTQAAARQGRPDVPNLDEMLGGRQKGKRIDPEDPFSSFFRDVIMPKWSEAPDAVKQEARDAIKAGELEPNCEDLACEFCNWVREQPEWKARNASSPDPGQRFQQEYGEGVAVEQETVPGILREAAATYEQRNPLYGDAYKHYGSAMMAFFPQGLYINEPEDWNRFGLFSMMVSKMTRIANNLTTGGHRDSSLDLSVYAAMMTELTEQK